MMVTLDTDQNDIRLCFETNISVLNALCRITENGGTYASKTFARPRTRRKT